MNNKDFPKQPSEIERIGVSFKPRLAKTGEWITSATYKIVDSADTDVTATMMVSGSEQETDEDGDGIVEAASIRVQAGTDGDYKLTVEGTTNLGNVLEEDRNIIVREN